MTSGTTASDRQWACEQIEDYRAVLPRYADCAGSLQQVLERASRLYAPLAIVQTRPKSIPSFAEKAIRKKGKYRNPLQRMTDLCGGRIITQTQAEVRAVCEFIEKHFDVDWENSVDVSQRLKPTEFGYRSIHYIVQFRRGVFPTEDVPVEIPEQVYPDEIHPLKAEIQVRTILEHAWATFGHDRVYKSAFVIPDVWQRELAVLAGMLEEVDRSFSQIQAGLQTYAANYGAYLSDDQRRDEIAILETVLTCDPQNAELAHRIGKLHMTLGNWAQAIDILTRYVDTGYPPLLRDLGVVLCKVNAPDPKGAEYRRGQKYLETASSPPHRDADALASLAGTWKVLDEERARRLYRQAYETDPTDPYAVSNYLVYEIAHRRDLTAVSLMAPAVRTTIQRSRDQAKVGMNLPWAYYNLGTFTLLLGQPYESLAAFAKAVQLSTNDWMIETSLRLLDRLSVVKDALAGFEWMRRLLLVGRLVKYPAEAAREQVGKLASPGIEPFPAPIVIVAGSCDAEAEAQMQGYRPLILEAFRDFHGTILSGGTTAGVSGLVGDVQQAYAGNLKTIGYVPGLIPTGTMIDRRYSQVHATEGTDFSILEPLQGWIDLLAAGHDPSRVKLLGIGGGVIAGAEYRIALALGAHVAVLEGSGGEAARLFPDETWGGSGSLIHLPGDPMAARAFIGAGGDRMEAGVREAIAQAVHAAYREGRFNRKASQDPALAAWDKLADGLKESNRRQADHISAKMQQIGYTLHPVQGRKPVPLKFKKGEIEILAEMEHGRWMVERLEDGWKWAPKRDAVMKTSPFLVPWSQLPDEVKEWDREIVRGIPKLLAEMGIEIHRTKMTT